MNILYIADLNSVHDLKWMEFFVSTHRLFVLLRDTHAEQIAPERITQLEQTYHFEYLGHIPDFSVRHFWTTYQTNLRIQALIREKGIDLIHLFYAEPNALWANFRKTWKTPILLTTRGTDVLQTIPDFFNKKGILARLVASLYKRAFRRIDAITCTSSRQIQSIQKYLQPTAKPALIRTGIDTQFIQSDTKAHLPTVLANKKYVLFPRNMSPLYQHELAIEAIQLLPYFLVESYTFVFVNKNSKWVEYVQEIQTLLEKAGFKYLFLDTLTQKEIIQTYKSAKLVVMTPLSDGAPVSALETMAAGSPLILPPLDYDQDLFGKGVHFFKKFEASELADTMFRILNNVENIDTKTAQQIAIAKADRRTEMQKLAAIYEQFIPTNALKL